jgi:hypothetical protein
MGLRWAAYHKASRYSPCVQAASYDKGTSGYPMYLHV